MGTGNQNGNQNGNHKTLNIPYLHTMVPKVPSKIKKNYINTQGGGSRKRSEKKIL